LDVEGIGCAYLSKLEEVLSPTIIEALSNLVVASVGDGIVTRDSSRCHLADGKLEISCKGGGGVNDNNRNCGIGGISACSVCCSICCGSICIGSICSVSGGISRISSISCSCVCSCISGCESHIVKVLLHRLISVAIAILHRHLLSAVDGYDKVPDVDGSPRGLKLDVVGTSSQAGKMHEAIALRVRD